MKARKTRQYADCVTCGTRWNISALEKPKKRYECPQCRRKRRAIQARAKEERNA